MLLFAVMGARVEPVTYWFAVGGTAVEGSTQKRLVELRYGLIGPMADGIFLRVSSIDGDESHAYRLRDRFVDQLLQGGISSRAQALGRAWQVLHPGADLSV